MDDRIRDKLLWEDRIFYADEPLFKGWKINYEGHNSFIIPYKLIVYTDESKPAGEY